jgi:hypothetical protein
MGQRARVAEGEGQRERGRGRGLEGEVCALSTAILFQVCAKDSGGQGQAVSLFVH